MTPVSPGIELLVVLGPSNDNSLGEPPLEPSSLTPRSQLAHILLVEDRIHNRRERLIIKGLDRQSEALVGLEQLSLDGER